MSDLPEPVNGWPLSERIQWILRQPNGHDSLVQRLVDLVWAEKEQSALVAQSIHFHPRKSADRDQA